MDDDDDFLYGGGGTPAHKQGSAYDLTRPKRRTDHDDQFSRVFLAVEYVSIVLQRVDTLPSPEQRQKPPPASRTLRNPRILTEQRN